MSVIKRELYNLGNNFKNAREKESIVDFDLVGFFLTEFVWRLLDLSVGMCYFFVQLNEIFYSILHHRQKLCDKYLIQKDSFHLKMQLLWSVVFVKI